ncbi:SDR family NAD(P)-dependent oxidoreductase [Spongiimicrobium sp. 3-5]|uniref:SDR family NAD(P)-dependent oxidoreductase n=1 Tax=Spongiimicrobium sp. 3-5 TaxID=3332596 RepID=UPI00397F901B
MKEKTVIVTGASTGIGKAITRLFLENGSNVIMNSKHEGRLKATYEEFGKPKNAEWVVGDVSKKETGERLVKTAIEKFGTIDVLINNAGVFLPKPFLDVDEEDLNMFLDINFKGTFFTSQAVIPTMKKQKQGAIINMGTVLVDHAIAGFPASAAVSSKGAIHTFTKQLAVEYGKDNIKVNTISPGIIRSPLQGKIGVDNADSLAGLHLLNRVGEPEEIAQAAYYLANADFVTGETIDVAGGHTVGHAIS